MNIRVGFQIYEFFRVPEVPRILDFASVQDALSWLKNISSSGSDVVKRLRDYAGDPSGIPNFGRLTDEQALERLALALHTRRIVVLAQGPRNIGGQPTKQPEAPRPAFPLSERTPRAASTRPSSPSDPSTFDPNLDPAALAAALVAAAAGGSPFCPECQKPQKGESSTNSSASPN